jgi:purine nucleosidase
MEAFESKIPVLLDTDIGSDIDDAVALAYLLHEPRCDLLGITTVTGDVQKRAAIAEIVCRASGRSATEIHCGRRNVLVNGPGQPDVPHYDSVAHLPHKLDRPENTAVDFLRSTIRSRPGEVVLLTIGPLGNIAALFALDPEIPFLLRGIVTMGGSFFGGHSTEFNAISDPVATHIVYAAARERHTTVGLDCTMKCLMPSSQVASLFVGEPLQTVALMAKNWFQSNPNLIFHDPLTAAIIFHPGLCEYRQGTVEIVPSTPPVTRLTTGAGPDQVAFSVDVPAFFEQYFSVF